MEYLRTGKLVETMTRSFKTDALCSLVTNLGTRWPFVLCLSELVVKAEKDAPLCARCAFIAFTNPAMPIRLGGFWRKGDLLTPTGIILTGTEESLTLANFQEVRCHVPGVLQILESLRLCMFLFAHFISVKKRRLRQRCVRR